MKLEDPNAMVRNSFFKLTNTSIDGLSCVCRLSSKLEVKIAGYSSSFFFCKFINSLGPDCFERWITLSTG